jgi:hypothetical protein
LESFVSVEVPAGFDKNIHHCFFKKEYIMHKKNGLFKGFDLSRVFILWVCLFLMGGACAEVSQQEETVEGMVTPAYRFDDVPTPPGFDYLQDGSFVFESSNLRIASLAYEGKMPVSQVLDFFKNTMPQYEWKLVSICEYRGALLSFAKEGWNALVSVVKSGSNTLVYINVSPTLEEPLSIDTTPAPALAE